MTKTHGTVAEYAKIASQLNSAASKGGSFSSVADESAASVVRRLAEKIECDKPVSAQECQRRLLGVNNGNHYFGFESADNEVLLRVGGFRGYGDGLKCHRLATSGGASKPAMVATENPLYHVYLQRLSDNVTYNTDTFGGQDYKAARAILQGMNLYFFAAFIEFGPNPAHETNEHEPALILSVRVAPKVVCVTPALNAEYTVVLGSADDDDDDAEPTGSSIEMDESAAEQSLTLFRAHFTTHQNILSGLTECRTFTECWLQHTRQRSVWEKMFPNALIGYEASADVAAQNEAAGIEKSTRRPVEDLRLPAFMRVPNLLDEVAKIREIARLSHEGAVDDTLVVPGQETMVPLDFRPFPTIPSPDAAAIVTSRKEKRARTAAQKAESCPYDDVVPGTGPTVVKGHRWNGSGGFLNSEANQKIAFDWVKKNVNTGLKLPNPVDSAPDPSLLNDLQYDAYAAIVSSNKHAILCGEGGSGKTFTVRQIMSGLSASLGNAPGAVLSAAYSGVASKITAGCTLHRLFAISIDGRTKH
jgi:hypothetical protein